MDKPLARLMMRETLINKTQMKEKLQQILQKYKRIEVTKNTNSQQI